MTDHRSPEEIERQLEKERAGLAEDLDDLRDKFSIDTIVRQTADQIRAHSGDIGASVSRAVKENPLAIAVTGVGLAWLIFGDKSGGRSMRDHDDHYDRYRDRRRDNYDPYAAQSTYYAGSRGSTPATGAARRSAGVQEDDLPAWARSVDHTHHGGEDDTHGGPSAKDRLAGASSAARGKMQETAGSMQDRAKALRERLSHGTEQLSEEGRARVLAAREKAHHARETAMARMGEGRDRAVDMFEEQPLIAGALALAVGAAIGAALPHTRIEDEYFGETSDELIREAERIFSEESAKLGDALQKTADDASDKVAEKARTTVEAAARSTQGGASGGSGDTSSGQGGQAGQSGLSTDRPAQSGPGTSQDKGGKGPGGGIPS